LKHRGRQALDAEVQFEQARFDRADIVYFIFPVYWWSDSCFQRAGLNVYLVRDWAYKYDEQGNLLGTLKNIPVKLIGLQQGRNLDMIGTIYTQAMQNKSWKVFLAIVGSIMSKPQC
jgi:NAD(P)H dehydrogenase (quinone)